jgi:predicted ATPase
MSTKSSWSEIAALFDAVLEQPPAKRAAWLAEACGEDENVRREVEQLLAAHERAEGVLDRPIQNVAAEALHEAEDAAAPNEQIGPYRILAELGRGGMGVVYKAEDPRLGRYVALKFLPPYLTASGRAKQRLLAEARTASALDHPNICTVYDVGETGDGRLFFAMAFYEGETLAERLRRRPLAASDALEIAVQVGSALAHAHESGVVHRDIKSSNIFLTSRGEAKVLDFGLAKQGPASLTDPGTRLGTVAYMSPEQAQGKHLDVRTDIWSLGVVLCEMFTGEKPFRGEDQQALLYAIVNEAPQLGPLPPGLQTVVEKALEKTPEHRYQNIVDLLEDLVAAGQQLGEAPAAVPAPVRPASVGRSKELAELEEAFASCERGGGLLVCITGEPGLGKTTLVEDFLNARAAQGAACFIARGRCSERLAGSEAYLPVFEALDSLLHGEARDLVIRLMKEKAPTWYVQIAPVPASADPAFTAVLSDAKVASQERLKRELASFFQELSRRRPVVIFCDDLHWADISTVDVLSYLISHSEGLRLLALTAYRPSDLRVAKHPFLPVQQELQSRGLCRELALGLLSEADIARYLDLEFPVHRFPGFLASLIHSRTEGNPLFMAELLRDLRDRGVISQRGGEWLLVQGSDRVQRGLPESIRGMIDRKIARLEESDRELLAAAAVQGQAFDSATISRVLDRDIAEVEERLADLAGVHRLVQLLDERALPDGALTQRASFVHVLYQNAFYGTLRARRQAALSAAIAEALVALHGRDNPRVTLDLAYLFESARLYDRAAGCFLEAARHAASVHANEEGVMLASRALLCARKLSGPKRLRGLVAAANSLGQLHLTLSRLQEAVADFELAEKSAAELGDVEVQVNAVCAGALALFNLKQMDKTREHASRALKLAESAGSETAAAAAEVVLGLERMCLGDIPEAEQSFQRSVTVLRRTGPPIFALEAIAFSALLQAWQLNYEAAHDAVDWTIAHARSLGATYHVVMNLFVRGMTKFNEGRLSEGFDDLWEGRRLAEVNKERFWVSRYPNTLGWVFRELGDLDSAIRYDLEGAQIARENGYGKPEANAHVNLARDYMVAGEPHRVLEHLDRAQQIFEMDVWFRWRYYIRLKGELAQYWLLRGDTKRAGACAAESVALAAPRKARKHLAWGHKLLGDVAVAEERFADAGREYETALAMLARHRCPLIEWRILLAAAEAASAYHQTPLAEHYRARCQHVIHSLADSLIDERLRRKFLGSEAVRAALL